MACRLETNLVSDKSSAFKLIKNNQIDSVSNEKKKEHLFIFRFACPKPDDPATLERGSGVAPPIRYFS